MNEPNDFDPDWKDPRGKQPSPSAEGKTFGDRVRAAMTETPTATPSAREAEIISAALLSSEIQVRVRCLDPKGTEASLVRMAFVQGALWQADIDAQEVSTARDLVASYDRQDELCGTEFECVDQVTDVLRLLKSQRDKANEDCFAVMQRLTLALDEIGVLRSQMGGDIALIRKYKTLSEHYHAALHVVRKKVTIYKDGLEFILRTEKSEAWGIARDVLSEAGRAAAEGSADETGEAKSGEGSASDQALPQGGAKETHE